MTHVHIACGHRGYGKAILSRIAFFYYIGNLIAALWLTLHDGFAKMFYVNSVLVGTPGIRDKVVTKTFLFRIKHKKKDPSPRQQ